MYDTVLSLNTVSRGPSFVEKHTLVLQGKVCKELTQENRKITIHLSRFLSQNELKHEHIILLLAKQLTNINHNMTMHASELTLHLCIKI